MACVHLDVHTVHIRTYVLIYAHVYTSTKPLHSHDIPFGLVVRIPGFHPGGPGSIPGMGNFCFLLLSLIVTIHNTITNYTCSENGTFLGLHL